MSNSLILQQNMPLYCDEVWLAGQHSEPGPNLTQHDDSV